MSFAHFSAVTVFLSLIIESGGYQSGLVVLNGFLLLLCVVFLAFGGSYVSTHLHLMY